MPGLLNLLLLIAIVGSLWWCLHSFRQQAPEKRRQWLIRYGLGLAALILAGLIIAGRAHWLTGLIAAGGFVLQRLTLLALKARADAPKDQQSETPAETSATTLSVTQALDIFGLDSVDNRQHIIQRHRELMQKLHPDRGGSDFLAAQLNQAKAVLIEHVDKRSNA